MHASGFLWQVNRGGRVFRSRTLADALESGKDNFLLLRFLAAAMVVYGHGPAIAGGHAWPDLFSWLSWGTYSGDIAVDIFFVTSGYMIAGSYLRRSHVFDFLWARVLRIYPAYLICLLVSAYLLGPWLTVLPVRTYLGDHAVLHYVSKNLELGKGLAWSLPGVFGDNPLPDIVNGSIWTLPAEIRMYLWVAVAGCIGVLARRSWVNVLLLALLMLGMLAPGKLPLVPLASHVRLAGYFALGVFCFVNRTWLRYGWWWFALATVLAWLLRSTMLYPFVFALALTAFVFAFAYATPWRGFNRFGDYSYGLYLWGFPMQQVVASHTSSWALSCNAVFALPLATVLAVVSWHGIEKPMLRFKSWPARLYRRLRSRNTTVLAGE